MEHVDPRQARYVKDGHAEEWSKVASALLFGLTPGSPSL